MTLALIFGAASMALGANGDNLVLGVLNNVATRATGLSSNVDGEPALRVVNTNVGTNDTALELRVQAPISCIDSFLSVSGDLPGLLHGCCTSSRAYRHFVEGGRAFRGGLIEGYRLAFLLDGGLLALEVYIVLFVVRRDESEEAVSKPEYPEDAAASLAECYQTSRMCNRTTDDPGCRRHFCYP